MKYLFAFCLSLCSSFLLAQTASFTLQQGDLLFQDLDCGAPCEAIEKVTQGVNGAQLSHVGIAVNEDGKWMVLEAISAGVVLTPLDTFLARSVDDSGNPKVLVGRVTEKSFSPQQAVAKARAYIGKPYDFGFDINNDSYYCSELVYESYQENGAPLFLLAPMTFNDPETQQLFPHWNNYFDERGIRIPEGELGLNPGGISRSPLVKIVHVYGIPQGYSID